MSLDKSEDGDGPDLEERADRVTERNRELFDALYE